MCAPIPIVDVSPLDGAATDQAPPVTAIASAAHGLGFFQVLGHGISTDLIDRVWVQTNAFFGLPMDLKQTLLRTKENPLGYYDRELTKNRRDLKEVFDFAAMDGTNRWPRTLPDFRSTLIEYFIACELLSFRLLGALCVGLGLPDTTLACHFRPVHTGFARLNHYPIDDPVLQAARETVAPLGDMALNHHSDAGALTLLLQDDVGGLQVLADGGWIDVTPLNGALVVNVGDMMQIWSNDRYHAARHRVQPVTDRPRYSIPFFFNPAYETDVSPLLATESPRYRTVNWGEFRRARADGDYADYGHEVQITDYRG